MDEQVLRGMAKWPNVPAVYGWLSLDRRGEWRLKGEPITNATVIGFINRNYERDAEGRWFFQNGPQRVYVSLEATPLVYRVTSGPGAPLELESHTGRKVVSIRGVWLDESGALLVESEHGVGVVDDRDLPALLAAFVDANGDAVEDAALDEATSHLQSGEDAPVWLRFGEESIKVKPVRSGDLASRFGFQASPEAAQAQ